MKKKWERKLFAMGIVTILVLLLAFNKHNSKTVVANVNELISSNKIKIKCKSTRFQHGESLNIEMMNLSNTSYKVIFPKGTIIKIENNTLKNYIFKKDEIISIDSKSYIEQKLVENNMQRPLIAEIRILI